MSSGRGEPQASIAAPPTGFSVNVKEMPGGKKGRKPIKFRDLMVWTGQVEAGVKDGWPVHDEPRVIFFS